MRTCLTCLEVVFDNNDVYCCFVMCFPSLVSPVWCISPPPGMRLRGGRDLNPNTHPELAPSPPPVAWLPGVLSKGVRLRLRLDHHDDQGRSCWQLVDLEAGSETAGRRQRDADTCTQSKSWFMKSNFMHACSNSRWPDHPLKTVKVY